MKKKADMGMGTLIVFIAMILIAAVAASVLIATTSKLQNKALDTGKLTNSEIGTGLQAVEIFAEDGSNQALDAWFITVKLSAGSDPLRFSDVLLTMSLSDDSYDYMYNDSFTCDSIVTKESGYAVYYQINGSSQTDGYLSRGDVAKICFKSPKNVTESKAVEFRLVPQLGSTLFVSTVTPDLIVDKRITIFP